MKALSVARSPSGDGLRRDGSKTAEARPRGTSSADPGLRRSRHAGARRERGACSSHATPVGATRLMKLRPSRTRTHSPARHENARSADRGGLGSGRWSCGSDEGERPVGDELIPISDEQAKLLREALEIVKGLGAYVGETLGTLPQDLVGILGGDWVRVRRTENLAVLIQRQRRVSRRAK